MQKPIRYYITKSDEEPTVRSVAVALRSPLADERPDGSRDASTEPASPPEETVAAKDDVKRRVKDAIRRRSP